MKPLRLFTALPVPRDIRRNLTVSFQGLRLPQQQLRLVSEENIHLTVKFIGEIPLNLLPDITEAFQRLTAVLRAVNLTLERAMLLPPRSPRTIGVGIQDNDELTHMFTAIDAELSRQGLVQPEQRRFTPHLTLARCNEPLLEAQRTAIEAWSFPRASWTADTLTLFQSEPGPRGPQYTPLLSLTLT